MPRLFPQGFLWGTASAAHQVEGQNRNNQWWDWEQQPGRIWHNDRSGEACGWWNDPIPDFDRMTALGLNSHRMSVEWSRIEPSEGQIDTAALDRYRWMLTELRQRGITPMITLHHFTNPRWLEATGGWLNPTTPRRFARFAAQVVTHLGDLCQLWCTINEPHVFATMSYMFGHFPPGQHNLANTIRVVGNLLRGHAAASSAIHQIDPQAQVGIVHNYQIFEPATPRTADVAVAALYDELYNRVILRALQTGRITPPFGVGERIPGLAESCQFIGLNYYTRTNVRFNLARPLELFGQRFTRSGVPQGDAGSSGESYGEVYPTGLYRALSAVAQLGLPIYITETGMPDATDQLRPWMIRSYLQQAHRAISAGIDLRGVFLWTLVDNFEWAEGWGLRFGLYHLDQTTGIRTLRPSAALYAIIARANALPDTP